MGVHGVCACCQSHRWDWRDGLVLVRVVRVGWDLWWRWRGAVRGTQQCLVKEEGVLSGGDLHLVL